MAMLLLSEFSLRVSWCVVHRNPLEQCDEIYSTWGKARAWSRVWRGYGDYIGGFMVEIMLSITSASVDVATLYNSGLIIVLAWNIKLPKIVFFSEELCHM